MGNALDWAALPIVCDMLGISDPEGLILQLARIRDHRKTE